MSLTPLTRLRAGVASGGGVDVEHRQCNVVDTLLDLRREIHVTETSSDGRVHVCVKRFGNPFRPFMVIDTGIGFQRLVPPPAK